MRGLYSRENFIFIPLTLSYVPMAMEVHKEGIWNKPGCQGPGIRGICWPWIWLHCICIFAIEHMGFNGHHFGYWPTDSPPEKYATNSASELSGELGNILTWKILSQISSLYHSVMTNLGYSMFTFNLILNWNTIGRFKHVFCLQSVGFLRTKS